LKFIKQKFILFINVKLARLGLYVVLHHCTNCSSCALDRYADRQTDIQPDRGT